MKMPKCMLSMLLLISCAAGLAQTTDSRPALFAAYPATVSVDKSTISNTINFAEGSTATIAFSPTFHFSGAVISNKQLYGNLQRVIIRAPDKTVLQVSAILNTDKTISYAGRLLNSGSADGYAIKNINGTYSLQKFASARILEPCASL